jgi:hypothetical protein
MYIYYFRKVGCSLVENVSVVREKHPSMIVLITTSGDLDRGKEVLMDKSNCVIEMLCSFLNFCFVS